MEPNIIKLFTRLCAALTRGRIWRKLFASLALTLAASGPAQTLTVLHTFTALDQVYQTNSDGAKPVAGLILSDGKLYGTASEGGVGGNGTVFALNSDGSDFTNLHRFTSTVFLGPNNDGASPLAGLILYSNTLYGTASGGGSAGLGALFAVKIDGTGFTNLASFNGTNGNSPQAGLLGWYGDLSGTTESGGTNYAGTVFTFSTLGTNLPTITTVHGFTAVQSDSSGRPTNSDGAYPTAGLISSGPTLYGTTASGSTNGAGTVFAVNRDLTGFTTLHTFARAANNGGYVTNSDGAAPQSGLVLSGNTLYGTTPSGGTNGNGTVFAINTDGTDFTILHVFAATDPSTGTNNDGASPKAGLVLSGNTLYATTSLGGSEGNGTVFSLSFPPPQLAIISSETNVILTWPANYSGFSYAGYGVQSTTNLISPVVWAPVDPSPVVVNGQYTVTNPVSGTQMYFRLNTTAWTLNFGTNWLALRHAMATAGATNYGFLPLDLGGFPSADSYDMFFLPVPDSVIELCNANPSLCAPYISGGSTPDNEPDYGCPGLWQTGRGYPIGSSVLVMIPSGAVGGCGGMGTYREYW